MDLQRIKNKTIYSSFLIFLITLILFFNPLFSNNPLGLDTIGHLSKVSYIKQYGFVNWDMSWYSGTLFLKLYSPLFYYLIAIFSNLIFATNLICFLSIFLTSLGIYLIIKLTTTNEKAALLSGVGFLTILSISYYWISAGNLPYFSALWTIPFSLYFIEKSLKENKNKYFVIFSIIFSTAILLHIVVGFIIGILMVIRISFDEITRKNIKKIFLFWGVPFLICSFWLIPFLFYSNTSGGYEGYVPFPWQLFGFYDQIAWGLHAGGIGILIFLFIPSITVVFLKKYWKDKLILSYLVFLILLGFILFGGLLNHYPLGVDPVRFILPFSIILSLFLGLTINQMKILKNKYFTVVLILIILTGLCWNFTVIQKNLDKFSYYKEDGRYQIFQSIINQKDFPLKNEFNNYRFGTSKFIFGENINYFMPNVPQTFGYQDAGMLNAQSYYDMRWHIWLSENISEAIYYLDWFGIKYFEIENKDSIEKFNKNSKFKAIMNYSNGYNFVMYEYLDAKPIISLLDNLPENNIGKVKEFKWERKNPDQIKITYTNITPGNVVLFKEFYHKNWIAQEIPSSKKLEIKEVGPGFMAVYPTNNSNGVLFEYKPGFFDILGIILSLFGIFLLVLAILKR